jgi:hypothetical protein
MATLFTVCEKFASERQSAGGHPHGMVGPLLPPVSTFSEIDNNETKPFHPNKEGVALLFVVGGKNAVHGQFPHMVHYIIQSSCLILKEAVIFKTKSLYDMNPVF